MKPDGTYTVEELLEICQSNLQSWEQEELALKIADIWGIAHDFVKDMDADDLSELTGYYVSEDDPYDYDRDDIDDFTGSDLMEEICNRDMEEDMLDYMDEDILVRYIKRSRRIKV